MNINTILSYTLELDQGILGQKSPNKSLEMDAEYCRLVPRRQYSASLNLSLDGV